jgi:hypothetical protein
MQVAFIKDYYFVMFVLQNCGTVKVGNIQLLCKSSFIREDTNSVQRILISINTLYDVLKLSKLQTYDIVCHFVIIHLSEVFEEMIFIKFCASTFNITLVWLMKWNGLKCCC